MTKARGYRALLLVDIEDPSNRLTLQTVPQNIKYNFENKIQAVTSPGRNNPFYHYTGSEDTLEFDISWYANEEDRSDVMRKCKWLEGMSKNDGYANPPKLIGIQWISYGVTVGGNPGPMGPPEFNNQPFAFGTWIIKAAPFDLQLLHPGHNMLPTLATQKVTLLRATANNLKRVHTSDLNY